MRHHIQGDTGVEEGDEQMKDLTLGTPHAYSAAASAHSPPGPRLRVIALE